MQATPPPTIAPPIGAAQRERPDDGDRQAQRR